MKDNHINDMDEEIKKLSSSKENFKRHKKTKMIILLFAIILISVYIFIILYSPSINNEGFEDKSESPNQKIEYNESNDSNVIESKEKKVENEIKEEVNLEGQVPIALHDWATEPFNPKEFWSRDGIYNELYTSIEKDAYSFITAVSWMPSSSGDGINEYTPKTNDLNKEFLDDGFANPDFSYTLSEDYYKSFIVGIERILNPIFGGWKADGEMSNFDDMLDSDWWNSQENKDKTLNWNNELLNRNLPELYDGIFWGEINKDKGFDLIVKEIGQDDLNQPILKVNVPIKLSSFDKAGGIVSLEGNLMFTMLSNKDSTNTNNRVVFKDIDIFIQNNK